MVIQVLRSLLNIKIIQFQKMKKELGKENQKSPKGLKNKKVNSDKENKNTSKVLLKNKKAKLDTKIKLKKETLKTGQSQPAPAVAMTKIEMREKQKKTREERRKKKDGSVFELGVQAKKVWEEVRREDCPKDRQVKS